MESTEWASGRVQIPRLATLARDDTAIALRSRRDEPAPRQPYRFTYVLLNPFLVFVTVNVPFARAEILM